jgi:hypothetical protein
LRERREATDLRWTGWGGRVLGGRFLYIWLSISTVDLECGRIGWVKLLMETAQTKILTHLTNWLIIFISYLGSKLNYMYTTYKIQKKLRKIYIEAHRFQCGLCTKDRWGIHLFVTVISIIEIQIIIK